MPPNRWLCIAVLALTLAACGDDDDDDSGGRAAQTTVAPAPAVTADMVAADGTPAGRVTITEEGGRLWVEARLTNLPPGFHGFHIHAVGKCERGTPPFTTAGGHLVVGEQSHPGHAGDQPVVLVMADRSADIRFTTDRYKLSDLQAPGGRAVIVHALPDNYANVPARYARQPDATTLSTGDAGDRIACGVVGGSGSPAATAGPASTTTTRPGSTTTARAAGALTDGASEVTSTRT
jgi:Cu-Zn family superoxide dismutase